MPRVVRRDVDDRLTVVRRRVAYAVYELPGVVEVADPDLIHRVAKAVANVARRGRRGARALRHQDAYELCLDRRRGDADRGLAALSVRYRARGKALPSTFVRTHDRVVADPVLDRERG